MSFEGGRVLTGQEKYDFLHGHGRIRRGTHSFTRKICHWPYCAHCGLVALKNEVSRRAARGACITEEDE